MLITQNKHYNTTIFGILLLLYSDSFESLALFLIEFLWDSFSFNLIVAGSSLVVPLYLPKGHWLFLHKVNCLG